MQRPESVRTGRSTTAATAILEVFGSRGGRRCSLEREKMEGAPVLFIREWDKTAGTKIKESEASKEDAAVASISGN
mgnify:CR=1 FL=1